MCIFSITCRRVCRGRRRCRWSVALFLKIYVSGVRACMWCGVYVHTLSNIDTPAQHSLTHSVYLCISICVSPNYACTYPSRGLTRLPTNNTYNIPYTIMYSIQQNFAQDHSSHTTALLAYRRVASRICYYNNKCDARDVQNWVMHLRAELTLAQDAVACVWWLEGSKQRERRATWWRRRRRRRWCVVCCAFRISAIERTAPLLFSVATSSPSTTHTHESWWC